MARTRRRQAIQRTEQLIAQITIEDSTQKINNNLSETQTVHNDIINGKSDPDSAHKDLQTAYDDLSEPIFQIKETRDAISSRLDEAEVNYLTTIDDEANTIQTTYQQTLNKRENAKLCILSFSFAYFND